MRQQPTALLIINPHSRLGGESDLREGVAILQNAGRRVVVIKSTSVTQTEREIETHKNDIDLVIVAGGDGTLSSTAPVLYRHGIALGILPLGTANDLARSLNIPTDLTQAFQIIAENNRKQIDLGVVNGHYFFNASHIGLGVNITHQLHAEEKKSFGVLSYLKALCTAITRRREFRVKMNIDGEKFHLRSIQITIGNGRYYGGGNIVDEESSHEDGLLRLYSLRPTSVWELLLLAPLLRFGKHSQGHIFNKCGRRIEIHTRSRMEIDADGEMVTHTPAVFEVLPAAFAVIAPAQNALKHSIVEDLLAS